MPTPVKALVESSIIAWARRETRTDLHAAAAAVGVEPDRLLSWESGGDKPTVGQLRLLAKKYHVPFALFFLNEPPVSRVPKFRDFRTLPEADMELFERSLISELIKASEKREIVLEYALEKPSLSPDFPTQASIDSDYDSLAVLIRRCLTLDPTVQGSWHTANAAFNGLRNLVESLGMLVLQLSSMPVTAIRGFSLSLFPLPVIVINRKDALAGRVFTLAHELVHIAISTSSVCDLSEATRSDSIAQRTEVFCNAVAGRILVPGDDLTSQPEVKAGVQPVWPDNTIHSLALRYGVSREVVLRRLLDVGLTTPGFYQQMREQYKEELANLPKPSRGRLPPPVDAISHLGRRYVTTMLVALDERLITASDFSSYIGLRLKHLPRLRDLA